MKELILDGGEQLDGQSRLLKLSDVPDSECVTVSSATAGIVAVLDRDQQRELVAYLAMRLWPLGPDYSDQDDPRTNPFPV